MTDRDTERAGLTDAAKASVINAGLVTQIKQAFYGHKPEPDNEMQALRKDAKAMAGALQQLLDGGGLDDTTSQKIHVVLSRLRGALQGGNITREALASAISEATSTMSAADGSGKSASAATIEQLWQKIDAYNKEIDDDFGKMRKAGIVFDDKLWEEHQRLSEYLHDHPRDIHGQEALDAVDDKLLHQAETQVADHPDATQAFNDAKKKSDDRHKLLDQDLAGVENRAAVTDLDWDAPSQQTKPQTGLLQDTTINDIEPPTVNGSPQKNSSKTFVRKQTNVCFRTKPHRRPVLFPFPQNHKCLMGNAFQIGNALKPMKPNGKSVQRYTLVYFITDLPGATAFQPLRKTIL